MERHFLAGVVIGEPRGDVQELTSLIDAVQAWRLPTVVACPPDSAELQTRVFAQGATPMPTPDAEAALQWFRRRLTDHTQVLLPAFAAPARVPALAQP
jgi:hypothetical protein